MDVPYVPLDRDYPRKIRLLADAIQETLNAPKGYLAIDLGCGEGMLLERLADQHGWTIYGIDGSREAVEKRVTPRVMFGDLTDDKPPITNVTCAICTEVAEHIPKEFANRLVRNVAACATDVIVWSAAPPGQEWPGHVNLQNAGYWLARFAMEFWTPDRALTLKLREAMRRLDAQHAEASESFYVLLSGWEGLEISTKP